MERLLLSPQSFLLLFISISSIYFFLVRRSKDEGSTAHPPGLRPYPLIGHLPQFLKNRHRLLDWFTECIASAPTNTITLRRPGGIRSVITADTANVEHVLRSHFNDYPKSPRAISIIHDFLGDGIFNSDGDAWRVQRKTANHEFSSKSLRSFVLRCVQEELLCRLLPLLQKSSLRPSVLDLQDVLERFAFDNICRVAFDHDPACLAADDDHDNLSSDFAAAFNDASVITVGRFSYALPGFWKIKRLLGVGTERRLWEAIDVVDGLAMQIIRSKKDRRASVSSSQPQAEDLLSRFVADEDHDDKFLRDTVISFMLAGKDTTSTALTWFFWLLSSRPDVEAKILDEIRSVRARHPQKPPNVGAAFDFEDLREMQYLHAAITESMRLYPPVPLNSLLCTSDDLLPDGTAVKKGWFMSYSPYTMGRMALLWGGDCEEYRPERWLEEETGAFQPESAFKYPVFHGGPRMCLGKEMAYIQMKLIAACVLERFAVEMADKEAPPKMAVSMTLRMHGGLPVFVRERESGAN